MKARKLGVYYSLSLIVGRHALLVCIVVMNMNGSTSFFESKNIWMFISFLVGTVFAVFEFASLGSDWSRSQKTHGSWKRWVSVEWPRLVVYIASMIFHIVSARMVLVYFPGIIRVVWAMVSFSTAAFLTAVSLNCCHIWGQVQHYKPVRSSEQSATRSNSLELVWWTRHLHELHSAQHLTHSDTLVETDDGRGEPEISREISFPNRNMGGQDAVEHSKPIQESEPSEQPVPQSCAESQEPTRCDRGEDRDEEMPASLRSRHRTTAAEPRAIETTKERAARLEHEFDIIATDGLAQSTVLICYAIILLLNLVSLILWIMFMVQAGEVYFYGWIACKGPFANELRKV